MARTEVYVRISDRRIMELGAPGRPVGRYVDRKGDGVERFAQIQAPKRSGALARSIHKHPVEWRGHRTTVVISADAGYARWVHNGTGPVIYPNGPFLWVPRRWSITGAKVGRMRRAFVAGQRAQPFMTEALDFVMANSRFLGVRGRSAIVR